MIRIYDEKNHTCSTINVNKSCRGCSKNMASNDPAMINQRQKIIQKVVRINSSLYTMNIAGLNVYQSPEKNSQKIYELVDRLDWNDLARIEICTVGVAHQDFLYYQNIVVYMEERNY